MGCYEDLPGDRVHVLSPELKLKRCPRYYLDQEQPELTGWVNEMLRLWRAMETGNLSTFCPNPTLKTIEAIDIIDTEITRQKNAEIEEMNKRMKSSNGAK